ncbi:MULTISPECIES: site-specific integrase [Niastella]|uniref:Site-specific integrase n=1 Tax=Niastella soli TaxID=2821487 RepID=A0ABS3YZ62_9BACT|nr:site-specific integrase [Niastella soli]MBO9203219.1 site-specific integrase [Niastella soli]
MEKSFGLFFFIKKSKSIKVVEHFIYLHITVDGIGCDISTKRKCDPAKWNGDAGRAEGKTEDVRSLNSYLDLLQRKVYEARQQLLHNGHPVTAENIKTVFHGQEIQTHKYMLMEVFKKHNDQMAELVGLEYAPGTLERFETAYRHTLSFLQWKYKVDDIDINKLDYEFISEYEFWIKSVRKCNHNSTIKYLTNFRKVINRCVRHGWLIKDPFANFKMTLREVERIALTETELQTLVAQQFPTDRLRVVRDIFLFSCYTGLAYADVKKLKRSEIIIGVDGEQWLVSRRQKTDISARIPLLPAALTILDRYKDHPQCQGKDVVLPINSNQKMNAYLKEIADVCGISKTLTYHIARHTFATTVTLTNGVPIETVSKMLGHRNLRTTQHYAKILDKKIGEDMKGLREKFR